MIIKMPKPTKAEMIRTFFNQWDTLDCMDKEDFMYYNYEAEDLAQQIRKQQAGKDRIDHPAADGREGRDREI